MIKNSFIIWIFAFVFTINITSCQHVDKEIHYIPENFIGSICIIFDQNNGTPVVYKNDYRVYKIPKNGILKSKFKKNTGVVTDEKSVKFYYYKNDATSKELEWNYNLDSLWYKDSLKIAVFNHAYLFIKDAAVFHYVVDTIKNKYKYNISPSSIEHIKNSIDD
jgi:hypothetical protein